MLALSPSGFVQVWEGTVPVDRVPQGSFVGFVVTVVRPGGLGTGAVCFCASVSVGPF